MPKPKTKMATTPEIPQFDEGGPGAQQQPFGGGCNKPELHPPRTDNNGSQLASVGLGQQGILERETSNQKHDQQPDPYPIARDQVMESLGLPRGARDDVGLALLEGISESDEALQIYLQYLESLPINQEKQVAESAVRTFRPSRRI